MSNCYVFLGPVKISILLMANCLNLQTNPFRNLTCKHWTHFHHPNIFQCLFHKSANCFWFLICLQAFNLMGIPNSFKRLCSMFLFNPILILRSFDNLSSFNLELDHFDFFDLMSRKFFRVSFLVYVKNHLQFPCQYCVPLSSMCCQMVHYLNIYFYTLHLMPSVFY